MIGFDSLLLLQSFRLIFIENRFYAMHFSFSFSLNSKKKEKLMQQFDEKCVFQISDEFIAYSMHIEVNSLKFKEFHSHIRQECLWVFSTKIKQNNGCIVPGKSFIFYQSLWFKVHVQFAEIQNNNK